MPVEVIVPDSELVGFSDNAKSHLKGAMGRYASELITEANRVESDRNRTNGTPEITQGMVDDADIVMRRGIRTAKTSIWIKILRIVSAVLALAVGVMYDQNQMQNGIYLLVFIATVAAAILALTVSTLRE